MAVKLTNLTDFLELKLNSDYMFTLVESLQLLIASRKINIYATICVILIGLIGNFITMFIFSQKKFRTNSSHVYLLCLSIIDTFFLVNHFFEDTIRAYISIYFSKTDDLFFKTIFRNETICRLANYFQYTFQLI